MRLGETETIEFKTSTAELKEVLISASAMLNKHGKGAGVKDNGVIVGQTIGKRTLRDIAEAFSSHLKPEVYPSIQQTTVQGKDCIEIHFTGSRRPYFAYGRAYIRVGDSDKQLSLPEMEAQFARKMKWVWEEEISNKKLSDVNRPALKEYMQKANRSGRIKFKYSGVKTTLQKLSLIQGNRLKKAAELLFCDENSMEIQAAVFAGTSKVTFLDIRRLTGNLFHLREQAEAYIKEHIRWRADMSESRRREIPEIPVRAFSEAVANSLCHRDYADPKGNEVAIFKDRIDIFNPGVFPAEFNPEDFIQGKAFSILRNPLIAGTLYFSEDVEKWASGLRRIYEECEAAGVKVEFNRVKTGFVVSFRRPSWEEGEKRNGSGQKRWSEKVVRKGGQNLTVRQSAVLDLIKEDPWISRQSLAKKLDINPSAVQKFLAILQKKEAIKRIGPDKGGYWQVISHEHKGAV